MGIQQIAAVVRWNGSSWYLQNDSDHAPIFASSIGIVQRSYGERLNIGHGLVTKVGAITLQPDNALLKDGYLPAGAEAGMNGADFELFRHMDVQGQLRWTPSGFVVDYQNQAFPVSVENLGSGAARIHHAAFSFPEHLPVLTARNGFYGATKIGMFGASFFDVHFEVSVPNTSCVCMFKRSGVSVVSPSIGYANAGGNYWLLGTMTVA